ncbi:hypothetical protein L1785_20110 [Antribacter sp. KLBMP9083]|uniref:Uncharacterized protein n=1 Tax=Antribacter soli TaxID=2910976 RepID=A0AA41QHL3_9MICO|nr:hypothetical protein [Antribacter soli]MCF4123278.1 hypothetical protein [Antribacter soli]
MSGDDISRFAPGRRRASGERTPGWPRYGPGAPGPTDPLDETLGSDLRPSRRPRRDARPEHDATRPTSDLPAWGTPSPTDAPVRDAGADPAGSPRRPARFWRWFGGGGLVALLTLVRLPAGSHEVEEAAVGVAALALVGGGVVVFVLVVLALIWLVSRGSSTPATSMGPSVPPRRTSQPFVPWSRALGLCLGALLVSFVVYVSVSDQPLAPPLSPPG